MATLRLHAEKSSVEELALVQHSWRSDVHCLSAMIRKFWFIWSRSSWGGFVCELLGVSINALIAFGSPMMWPDRQPLAAQLRVSISTFYLVALFARMQGRASFEIWHDKVAKLRICQQINGLRPHVYWLSWGLYHLAVSAGYSLLLALLTLLVPQLFLHSNKFLLWLMFTLAHMQYAVVAWFLGIIFDHPERLGYAQFLFVFWTTAAIGFNMFCHSWVTYCVAQLVPLFSIYSTLASIQWLEAGGVGLSFKSVFEGCCSPARPQCGGAFFAVGAGMMWMFVTNVLYVSIVFWLDQVVQGMWGIPQRWDFCLPCGRQRRSMGKTTSTSYGSINAPHRSPALVVHELVKSYNDDGHTAVNHLNLVVQNSEIFALLGHNGSGKTTMIHCAVGMIPPTSGSIHINGCSINEEPEMAQRQLALCPQESPVFDEFTVQQHLEFFAALRGVVGVAQLEGQVAHALDLLDLSEKRGHMGIDLSGGQRRRLWVATALLGSAPVVLLDEPSSGMDPASRHKLWAALAWIRCGGRTVIFTTHYLEEADIMADRKAILAAGQVKAVGTSLELKKQYAVGYCLTLELPAVASTAGAVRDVVIQQAPKAVERPSQFRPAPTGTGQVLELTFMFAFHDADLLGPLLTELDQRSHELEVRDCGLQMSSLEDVFLKLAPWGASIDESEEPVSAHSSLGVSNSDASELSKTDLECCANRCSAKAHFHPFVQTAALMQLRAKVLLDGGLCIVILRFVLPVVLINTYMVKSHDNVTPSGWYTIACGFPLSLSTMLGPTMRQLSEDTLRKRKLMMLSQGMSPTAYWCAGFLTDYLSLLPVVLAVPLFASLFHMPYLCGPGLSLVVAESFVFPIHLVVFMYTVQSFIVVGERRMESSNQLLQCVGTCLGATLPSMFVWGLINFSFFNFPHNIHQLKAAHKAHVAFSLIFPPYSMPGVILYVLLQSFQATGNHPKRPVPLSQADFFSSTAALPFYLSSVPTALLALRLLVRAKSASRAQGYVAAGPTVGPAAVSEEERDVGVLAEEARLRQGSGALKDTAVAYCGLHYAYLPETGAPVFAVRGVSLSVHCGECFGLLGPNGAGKTTTLACLTGELWPPSAGSVFVSGKDIAAEGFGFLYGQLGMCLQHDTHLWDPVSGRDHLAFYGRMKGVPGDRLEHEVDAVLRQIQLRAKDADRPIRDYSGGMKRRLSVGIALIHQPRVVFMDEPTAAVDVMVKRQLWASIKSRGADQTVLLTSHQMEEVEALCDRVAVQVLGQLRAVGTPAHLRRRYGSGYQLELLTDAAGGEEEGDHGDTVSELERFVCQSISPSAKLLDAQPGRTVFQLEDLAVKSNRLRLAAVFTEVCKAKDRLSIKDYSLRQPTLEQVFIRFAKEQANAEAALVGQRADAGRHKPN